MTIASGQFSENHRSWIPDSTLCAESNRRTLVTLTAGTTRPSARLIPVSAHRTISHGVSRGWRAASEAAFRAGLSPEVVHAEPGILVLRFIEGRTFAAEDVRQPANLERIVPLIRLVHTEMPRQVRGPALIFWVFHVVRDYAHTLREGGSRHLPRLPGLIETAAELERDVGPVEIVYAHNDLLPANLMDDGRRLWLIDWDYAGFNSPLFDLANLASNNELSPEQEGWLLEAYFGRLADGDLRHRYSAMKCASLLRETMWSMVSEIHSKLAFDYAAYTADYLGRLERALAIHRQG